MCQINNVLHNTGDKPLICYKVLVRDSGGIKSPYFRACSWELGKTKLERQLPINKYYYIGYGFFHAFIDKVDAFREQIDWGNTNISNDYIIAEMEVPPHTDYYTGVTDNGDPSIATSVITFKKILREFSTTFNY